MTGMILRLFRYVVRWWQNDLPASSDQTSSDNTVEMQSTLSNVYHDFFEQHKPDDHDGNVVIPYDDFEYWRSRLEEMVEKDIRRVNQRNADMTNETLFITNPSASVAERNFVGRFQTHMKNIGIPLQNISVDNVTARNETATLIVVCNNYSRIITDLEKSLENIRSEQYRRTIVIVMHVGPNAPVSPMSTTEHLRNNGAYEQFQNLREIIDMMNDDGHSCDLNTCAYEILKRINTERNEGGRKCLIV